MIANAQEFRHTLSRQNVVMGVLNVTPDSFSDGGQYDEVEQAIERGKQMVAQGADIIDVGGESTRPGATPIGLAEEQRRVLPVLRALVAANITVSVDTLHAATAEAAALAGAKYINDVSGGTHDPEMLSTLARITANLDTELILGHWRGIPDQHHQRSTYDDVVREVRQGLGACAEAAVDAGVPAKRIIIDPGLGFDKTTEQGWQLLANLEALTSLGYRVLIGASRKRMISDTIASLHEAPVSTQERDGATSVVTALSLQAGAWGVRVHDVSGSVLARSVACAWSHGAQLQHASQHNERFVEEPSSTLPPVSRVAAQADVITLTGVEVFAHHGVFDFERERGQRFVIDAEVYVDLGRAAAEDALDRTVNYGELAAAIVAAVSNDPVDLIETVAERVADVALSFSGVNATRVTVHKPDAPIAATFGDVSVTVVRDGRHRPKLRGVAS